ncbi:MAG: hypothetical protein HPY85_00120 [Anaerolineae bacterium]|nr:hypothetical protein [Anaerolineae bacterium]
MNEPQQLIDRMVEIGESLSRTGNALALIGLGSVGAEIDRLDEYSDLDFFAIVKPGTKEQYLADLGWLTSIAPAAWYFQNTQDGYKFLYSDGIFCEFAVFEESELSNAVFAPGRIYWKAKGMDDSICIPQQPYLAPMDSSIEWLVGEALSNLYVGLARDQRGEKLSAMRFIQGYAVDRVLALIERMAGQNNGTRDPFNIDRRFETRHAGTNLVLPEFLQGYEKNQESAAAILRFLEDHFDINAAISCEINRLCCDA